MIDHSNPPPRNRLTEASSAAGFATLVKCECRDCNGR